MYYSFQAYSQSATSSSKAYMFTNTFALKNDEIQRVDHVWLVSKVKIERILHLFLVFLFLTLSKSLLSQEITETKRKQVYLQISF